MKKALLTAWMAVASTSLAFAQQNGAIITVGNSAQQGQVNGSALINLLNLAQNIVSRLVPFAFGVAILAFFWYLIGFIAQPGDGEARTKKLQGMGYSILALFVMLSIYGIIALIGSIFGVGQGGTIPIPSVPSSTN